MSLKPRVVVLALVAAVMVGGLSVAGWLTLSAQAASDVSVSWSPESPACEGTTVAKPGSKRPIIDAEETMRCVITVEVANGSGRTVHVTRAVAPMVGPRTGAVITAENARPATKRGGDDIDAVYPLDHALAAGESMTFDVVLVLNPNGCNAGATLGSSHWPTVTVDVLGRDHVLHGDKDFAFHREGATPGCHD